MIRRLRRLRRHLVESASDAAGCLYSRRYYAKLERQTGASATVVAESLTQRLRPSSVIDVGCGSGQVLAAFAACGVTGVGLERSRAALALCRERGLEVLAGDLRRPPADLPAADLVLCFEVAEHLPPSCAADLVALLCRLGPTVALTAAQPGQGGVRHLNEQPPSYWQRLFADQGHAFCREVSAALSQEWERRGVVSWLVDNLMLFGHAGR